MWLSCNTNKQDSTNLTSFDVLKYNYKYDSILAEKYENIIKQIKKNATFLMYSDIYSNEIERSILVLDDSIHNQVYSEIISDSNVIECIIWIGKPKGILYSAYENITYPMAYNIRKVYRSSSNNPNYISEISVIPELRIFEKNFDFNTIKMNEKENKYMIANYQDVLYIKKEWIENDFFIKIELFVKQNDSDNFKSKN
jgi:hypothetical protein